MHENIENFCKELGQRLDAVDKRMNALKASAKGSTEKAKAEAKAQLASLENRAKDEHTKVRSAEAKMKAWLEEKKTTTGEKIAAWKAQRDISKLAAHAKSAEQYAVVSMELAVAAVDEAERAALEAVVARMDADDAQTSRATGA